MRSTQRRACWTLVAAVALATTLTAQAQNMPVGNTPGTARTPVPLPSQARLTEILIELAWLAEPATFPCPLAARATDTALEVGGMASTPGVKQRALELARVNCKLSIVDKVVIRPDAVTPIIHRSNDDLCRDALACMNRTSVHQSETFELVADTDGRIILSGEVGSHEEKLAISRRLSQLAGCTAVINKLTVFASLAKASSSASAAPWQEPKPQPAPVPNQQVRPIGYPTVGNNGPIAQAKPVPQGMVKPAPASTAALAAGLSPTPAPKLPSPNVATTYVGATPMVDARAPGNGSQAISSVVQPGAPCCGSPVIMDKRPAQPNGCQTSPAIKCDRCQTCPPKADGPMAAGAAVPENADAKNKGTRCEACRCSRWKRWFGLGKEEDTPAASTVRHPPDRPRIDLAQAATRDASGKPIYGNAVPSYRALDSYRAMAAKAKPPAVESKLAAKPPVTPPGTGFGLDYKLPEIKSLSPMDPKNDKCADCQTPKVVVVTSLFTFQGPPAAKPDDKQSPAKPGQPQAKDGSFTKDKQPIKLESHVAVKLDDKINQGNSAQAKGEESPKIVLSLFSFQPAIPVPTVVPVKGEEEPAKLPTVPAYSAKPAGNSLTQAKAETKATSSPASPARYLPSELPPADKRTVDAKPQPSTSMSLRLQAHLKQRVEAACLGEAHDIEVVPQSSTGLVIRLKVKTAAQGQALGRKILKMPELTPYKVDLEIKLN